MIRLSSSLTLGFALFFPVFWYVLFGCLTLFVVAMDPEDLPLTNPGTFKIGLIFFFLFFGFFIYKGPAKLKRVEFENGQLYVTNYFKTITFHIKHVSKIKHHAIPGLRLVTLELDFKSLFGKKIRFLSDAQRIQFLLDQHGEERNAMGN